MNNSASGRIELFQDRCAGYYPKMSYQVLCVDVSPVQRERGHRLEVSGGGGQVQRGTTLLKRMNTFIANFIFFPTSHGPAAPSVVVGLLFK